MELDGTGRRPPRLSQGNCKAAIPSSIPGVAYIHFDLKIEPITGSAHINAHEAPELEGISSVPSRLMASYATAGMTPR